MGCGAHPTRETTTRWLWLWLLVLAVMVLTKDATTGCSSKGLIACECVWAADDGLFGRGVAIGDGVDLAFGCRPPHLVLDRSWIGMVIDQWRFGSDVGRWRC